MLNQKGHSFLYVFLVVTLLAAGYYIGITSKSPLIANLVETVKLQSASNSSNLTQTASVSSEIAAQTSTDIQPSSSPSIQPNAQTPSDRPPRTQETYNSSTDAKIVNISGNYYIGDFDKVNWMLSFPKTGGEIRGSAQGACTGEITGYFNAPDSDGDGKVQGEFVGKCTPVPGFSFKTDVKSSYEGMIHLNEGKIDVIHNTTEPYPLRGSFNLYFQP